MREHMLHGSTSKALQILMSAAMVFFSSLSSTEAYKEAEPFSPAATLIGRQSQSVEHETWIAQRKRSARESDGRPYERLSPDERDKLKGKSRKWEDLPKEKRLELERRMDRWQQLPPEEKDLIRKRHQQWQELAPEEQERIREKLNRWDSLAPQEQEEIRRKFKRP